MVSFCKARTLSKGEKVFNAPKDADGYFERTEKRDQSGALEEVVYRKYVV